MRIPDVLEKKLLIPGWGGDLLQEELEFIESHLKKSQSLRIKWGFTKKRLKRMSHAKIKKVANGGN